ncbi:MAG: hypothetical protein Q8L84_06765, partial [Hyphomonas sp.]|nr:hypothetical protein [Hyphomonas sp.]
MQNYYRYRPISLLYILNKRDQYFESILNKRIPFHNYLNIAFKKGSFNKSLIQKVKKIIGTKGKYRYRERFNFNNSQQLKSLAYDPKKKCQERASKKEKKNQKPNEDEYSSEEEDDDNYNNNYKKSDTTDLNVWKTRNGYEKNVKVYIVKGGYRDVKKGLEERGWVENPDIYSPCFDFKWTCKVIDINYENLKE